MDQAKKISQAIQDRQKFLVATHFNADGDAVGSLSAMGHILTRLDKDFTLYIESGIPERFAWIDLPDRVMDKDTFSEIASQDFDWVITLDCADLDRLGDSGQTFHSFPNIINIDHHLGNPGFGLINWIDPQRSSVGEMLAELALELSLPLTAGLGESVYLALVSDTGSFSYGNTRPRTMELAALILGQGLNLNRFTASLNRQWNLPKIKLHGRAMQTAKVCMQGKVGLISVSRADLEETGTSSEDCEGLVNYVRQIKGVEVAASIREEQAGHFKFSLRSWESIDVRSIAARFGGGGHFNAAGGSLSAPEMSHAENLLLRAIKDQIHLSREDDIPAVK